MNSHKAGFMNVYATHDPQSTDSVAADFICEIGPAAREPGSEAYANANLIAAAPDLLLALKTLLSVFDNKLSDNIRYAAIIRAKQVIALAQGDPK